MGKVDRSVLTANDQSMGQYGDPDKLEASISHLADKIDGNDNEYINHKDSAELAHPDKSVTEKKLADFSVSTRTIADGAVGPNQIASNLLLERLINTAELEQRGVNVRWYGTNTQAFTVAIAYAKQYGLKVYIPSGVYEADIILQHDDVTIEGAGMPFFDGTNLVNGTIIKGKIDCNSKKRITIKNLGIDARGKLAGADAALNSGNVLGTSPIYHDFENIACLGDGYSADMSQNKHAILCQAGTHINIHNIKMYRWYHGLALRAGYVNASKIYAYQCGFTSVIVKAATGNTPVRHVNIDNVLIEGTVDSAYNRGGQVHVQSFNDGCEVKHVNISNVTSHFGGTGAVIMEKAAGSLSHVTVTNAKAYGCGDTNTRAAFEVSGTADKVTFVACMAEGSTGYGFRNTGGGTDVKLYGCVANGSGVSDKVGTFATDL